MLTVVTPASGEPVTLADAREHLHITLIGGATTHPADGPIQNTYIPAAREYVETLTGRLLRTTGYEYTAKTLAAGGIALGAAPVTAIASIQYQDAAGATQTLPGTDYEFDEKGRITPVEPWPYGTDVEIAFTAGYATANIPPSLRAAMMLLIGHFYMNRSAEIVGSQSNALKLGVENLCVRHIIEHGV